MGNDDVVRALQHKSLYLLPCLSVDGGSLVDVFPLVSQPLDHDPLSNTFLSLRRSFPLSQALTSILQTRYSVLDTDVLSRCAVSRTESAPTSYPITSSEQTLRPSLWYLVATSLEIPAHTMLRTKTKMSHQVAVRCGNSYPTSRTT